MKRNPKRIEDAMKSNQYIVRDNIFFVDYKGKLGQVVADCDKGWICWVKGDIVYFKKFKYTVERKYLLSGGGNVSIFTSDSRKMKMVEIEVSSPEYKILPGETKMFKEVWKLYRNEKKLNSIEEVVRFIRTESNIGEAYLINGMYHEFFRMPEILKQLGIQDVTKFYCRKQYTASALSLTPSFPYSLSALKKTKYIFLNNAILTLWDRTLVQKFVEQGGTLIVFGGYYSFGKGEIKGTVFENLYPVKVMDCFDIIKTGKSEYLVPNRSFSYLRPFRWKDNPVCLYRHNVLVKNKASILVRSGEKPFLVSWKIGKGRVIVCLGTPLGEPQKGQLPFWEWRDWPAMMAAILKH